MQKHFYVDFYFSYLTTALGFAFTIQEREAWVRMSIYEEEKNEKKGQEARELMKGIMKTGSRGNLKKDRGRRNKLASSKLR